MLAAAVLLLTFAATDPPAVEVRATSLILAPDGDAPARAVLDVAVPGGVRSGTAALRGEDGAVGEPIPLVGGRALVPAPLPDEGTRGAVTLRVFLDDGRTLERDVQFDRPEDGWTMWLVPGFHFDPVWWNTQANYTETGARMDPHVGPGLRLMEEHLAQSERDPDYVFAVHQLPYVKTFLEARPAWRDRLRAAIDEGRAGVVGGTYNELSSTLVSLEATIRNGIYGTLFQRDVLHGRSLAFWQCDVFGHDPSFPGVMATLGRAYGAFARGPFHQWGIDRAAVHFPSEFHWAGPGGSAVVAHYMTGHYGVGYERLAPGRNRTDGDARANERVLADLFEDLKRPAATRNVMLPMHMDFVRPLEDLGEIVRAWNARFASPTLRIDTSDGFFAAVDRGLAESGRVLPLITRDMNPIYTGCAVSFADLKTANREAESAVRDAELWATCAWLEGAPFPWAAIDRAWRQLLFNAHHDGVTGSMSDEVYLDVMAGYRDAVEIAREVEARALRFLGRRITVDEGDGTPIAWNPLARPVPATGSFAGEVPAVGWCRPRSRPADARTVDGTTLENEHFRVALDLDRGGAIASLVDKASGRELLRGPGNALVLLDEYPVLPGHGEGPWHLAPTGASRPAADGAARVVRSDRWSITVEARDEVFTKRQTTTLLPGERMLRVETEVVDWKGRNELLRVTFPFDVPGGRPVHETAGTAIGRPFARDVDTAVDPWTLDQACHRWVDLSSTLVVGADDGGPRVAVGVADVVLPEGASEQEREGANELVAWLARSGVTSTLREAGTRPYGDLAFDSNVPDLRIVLLRDAADHPDVLEGAEITTIAVPVGESPDSIRALLASFYDGEHELLLPGHWLALRGAPAPDHGVAVVNEGSVSVHVAPDGTVGLNLLRSCPSWPSGLWIDGPALGAMHGTHTFRYAVLPHDGDWRGAGLAHAAMRLHHDPAVTLESAHEGDLPARGSFLQVERLHDGDRDDVELLAFKPVGFPYAHWRTPPEDDPSGVRQVALRLRPDSGDSRGGWTTLGTRTRVLRAERASPLEAPLDTHTISAHAIAFGGRCVLWPGPSTLLLEIEGRPPDPDAPSLDPVADDPAESAYWLENLGEGVTGNGLLAVVPDARAITLAGETTVGVSIVWNGTDAGADVPLRVEGPRTCEVTIAPERLRLDPGGVGRAMLTLVPRKGIARGTPSAVRVVAGKAGVRTWDVEGTVWVGLDPALADAPPVTIDGTPAMVGPGGTIRATVRNDTDGPLTGTLTWLGPRTSWEVTRGHWRTRATLEADEARTFEVPVPRVVDTFVLPKWHGGGRVVYGPPVRVVADPRTVQLGFATDRVRLATTEAREVPVRVTAVERLDGDVTLEAPAGFEVSRGRPSADRSTVSFDVRAAPGVGRGQLTARGPGGALARIPFSIAPRLVARPGAPEVAIDGALDEWDDAEFAAAGGPLGNARAAVRWAETGLALAFEVDDDRFAQHETGSTIWKGDSVQWALSITPAESAGYAGTDLEFGVARTPAGDRVWCWYGGERGTTGLLDEAPTAVRLRPGALTYEVFLPRAALPGLALREGAVLGFSWIANDDDGEGYRGATEWTPGMTGTKDSSRFGE
ncbi:MAG: glycoside hydrolase family 38 C-terminal domain-containing protein, partial [Planctomycetota bacterium JB042]